MNLGISNIGWNNHESEEVYALMKKYGFDGLEIAPTKVFEKDPYNADSLEISRYYEEIKLKGFKIIALQSILYGKNHLKLFNRETIEPLKAYLKASIDFGARLNAPIIVFGSPKNRIIPEGFEYPDIYIEFFREIGTYSMKKNIKFCIEANPKEYGTNFITTLQEELNIITYLNNPGIGLHIDLGAMLLNKESFTELIPHLDRINHIHISQPFLKAITKENIHEYQGLKALLKEGRYKGYISIEMAGEEFSNISRVEAAMYEVANLFNKG